LLTLSHVMFAFLGGRLASNKSFPNLEHVNGDIRESASSTKV